MRAVHQGQELAAHAACGGNKAARRQKGGTSGKRRYLKTWAEQVWMSCVHVQQTPCAQPRLAWKCLGAPKCARKGLGDLGSHRTATIQDTEAVEALLRDLAKIGETLRKRLHVLLQWP
jgi:hypothetical protein